MRGNIPAGLAAAALVTAPLAAQPADLTPEAMAKHLADVGTWKFSARKNGPDGKPECVETWHFDADGTGWVQSGDQRVERKWRTSQGDKTDRWLWVTSLSSTAGVDCMGRESNPASYPKPEGGFVVMFFNAGGAMTCQPAAYVVDKDGNRTGDRMLRDVDCWGNLNPMPQE